MITMPAETEQPTDIMSVLKSRSHAIGYWLETQMAGLPGKYVDVGRTRFKDADGTAVIPIYGMLTKNPVFLSDDPEPIGTCYTDIKRSTVAAIENPNIGMITFIIDSPGGSVDGCEDLADFIHDVSKVIPTVAQIDGLGCSAAYWLASQCGRVYCSEEVSIVGSMGVYAIMADTSRLFEDGLLMKLHIVKSGKHKGDFAEGLEITEEMLEPLQRQIDGTAEVFRKHVSIGRAGKVKGLKGLFDDADAHLANEAIELGLIDAIQSVEFTLEKLDHIWDANRGAKLLRKAS